MLKETFGAIFHERLYGTGLIHYLENLKLALRRARVHVQHRGGFSGWSSREYLVLHGDSRAGSTSQRRAGVAGYLSSLEDVQELI